MLKKIIITIMTLIAIAFMPFAFVFASIYFMIRPDKAKEYTQDVEVEKTTSNDTGLH